MLLDPGNEVICYVLERNALILFLCAFQRDVQGH